jgi:hypothetical protein
MPFSVASLARHSSWRLASAVCAVFFAIGMGVALVPKAGANAPVGVYGEHFVDGSGTPIFLLGVNYEGPADRAWQMWDDGRFEPGLISSDFQRARSAGVSVIRVFIQQSLADDIRAVRWSKLDHVLRLADQHGIKLILTFADYPEGRLANLIAIDAPVAARYRGRPTILAYDLKNEPRFGDLALSEYPPGAYVALQDRATAGLVGETIPRSEIAVYRTTEQGEARIPSRLNDEQAYVYANVLGAFLGFLDDAQAWARENDSTTVSYLSDADSSRWDALVDALNDTLATWTKLRIDSIRAADPEATITVGHVDPILASLPANNLLDYRTLHRYPSASSAGVESAMALFRDVRAAIPGKALVLGEFGFSNADVPEDRSGALEAELVQAVRDNGGAGALKWMLNDFPQGANPRENAFGMFRGDGTAKPVVGAFPGLAGLVPSTVPVAARPASYDIPAGYFFTQTVGRPPDRDASGYAVTNADEMPFWDAWQRLGLGNVGYPLSRRFVWRGLATQVFHKAVLQWQPGGGVSPINLLDDLSGLGLDNQLRAQHLVPHPLDPSIETAESWDEIVAIRMAMLDENEALATRYRAAADPLTLYGLPTSRIEDVGSAWAIRTQRAVLLLWKDDVPWASAGEVTVANAGEIAKELGMFPMGALVPEPAPFLAETVARSVR